MNPGASAFDLDQALADLAGTVTVTNDDLARLRSRTFDPHPKTNTARRRRRHRTAVVVAALVTTTGLGVAAAAAGGLFDHQAAVAFPARVDGYRIDLSSVTERIEGTTPDGTPVALYTANANSDQGAAGLCRALLFTDHGRPIVNPGKPSYEPKAACNPSVPDENTFSGVGDMWTSDRSGDKFEIWGMHTDAPVVEATFSSLTGQCAHVPIHDGYLIVALPVGTKDNVACNGVRVTFPDGHEETWVKPAPVPGG